MAELSHCLSTREKGGCCQARERVGEGEGEGEGGGGETQQHTHADYATYFESAATVVPPPTVGGGTALDGTSDATTNDLA